jgi:dimethylhistidine N-methyltransferase
MKLSYPMTGMPTRIPGLATVRVPLVDEAIEGLSGSRKTLPAKWFYDERGSRLFEEICTLDEYYPTRTETAIMERYIEEIVAELGSGCLLIEYGSGSSRKTRILLDRLPEPAGYVPIDISADFLRQIARGLADEYPGLRVLPVSADYTRPFALPDVYPAPRRRVVYFPGSTIGNFEPAEALAFLRRAAFVCGPGGGLLIGVDLQKEVNILEAAYNDARGVTAAFNKNLLHRLNREARANFDPTRFEHHAFYNREEGRIEMHLVSLGRQTATVADHRFFFEDGESIHTENSYKYTLQAFERLACLAGFRMGRLWTDDDLFFGVLYLTVGGTAPA